MMTAGAGAGAGSPGGYGGGFASVHPVHAQIVAAQTPGRYGTATAGSPGTSSAGAAGAAGGVAGIAAHHAGQLVYLPHYARPGDVSSPAYYTLPTAGAVNGVAYSSLGDVSGARVTPAGGTVFARAPGGAAPALPHGAASTSLVLGPGPGGLGAGVAPVTAPDLFSAASGGVGGMAGSGYGLGAGELSRFPRESPRFQYGSSELGRSMARDAFAASDRSAAYSRRVMSPALAAERARMGAGAAAAPASQSPVALRRAVAGANGLGPRR